MAVTSTARHEAGHWVAAREQGFTTGGITIEVLDYKGGCVGGAELELCCALRTAEEVAAFIERRVTVLWAGALAESLNAGKVDETAAHLFLKRDDEQAPSARVDYAKARELLNLLRNFSAPEANTGSMQQTLDKLTDRTWQRAIEIVERHAKLITKLGERLARKVTHLNTVYTLTPDEIAGVS